MKRKLAIVSTHPIQYNAPLFKALTARGAIDIKVFFTWGASVLENKFDPGFGKVIKWDIPLLEGYAYEFLENIASDKGSHHFNGIKNPGIIEAIDAWQPDALLVYGWSFVSHLAAMKHFKKTIPIFFRGDSTLLDEASWVKSLLRQLVLKYVYRFVDKAFYVGNSNKAYFLQSGLKSPQLVFAPHAVENERFNCLEVSCKALAAGLKKALQIAEGHVVFLFAGKLEQKKDPGLLIQAFIKAGFGNGVHLVLVGNGVLEQVLKLASAGNHQIHFLDFQNQSQMPAVYEMADVFVLPSAGPGETWGLAVNEAMANGTAVVVSNRCGCAANLVEDGVNGYQFVAGDAEDLCSKLKAMLATVEGLNNMKLSAKEKIKAYSISALANIIEGQVLAVEKKQYKN